MKPIYKITLPVPPSMNMMYPTGKSGRRFLSDRGKAWKAEAAEILEGSALGLTNASYKYVFYPKSANFGDTENYCKIITDSLVEAGIIQDDKHTILKNGSFSFGGYDKQNPRVEISIYKASAYYPKGYTPEWAKTVEHLEGV